MRSSISRRLLAITFGVISLAVALAGAVLLWQHSRELHRGFEDGAVVLAQTASEHCVGPLWFEDGGGGSEILAKFERSNMVARALLTDRNGRVLARYDRPGTAAPLVPLEEGPSVARGEGYIHVFEPVMHRGERLGTLYLAASSAGVHARVAEGTVVIVLAGLGAIAAAAMLAWLLQGGVTRPILRLAETMRGITGESVHSTRVEHASSDEIGVLYAGFNRMLDQLAAGQAGRDRTEARLRALIAALPDPVFVLERTGHIVELLGGRPELLGMPASDLRGRSIAELTVPDQAGRFERVIHDALTSDTPQRLAYELDLPNGRRWLDAMILPITERQREPGAGRGVLLVLRDVTERQTLELELRQVQKMEALGRLAGGVAHDFNNILTAITGYGSLLVGRNEREGRRPMLELAEILKAAERAALLTQQLLAFSKRQVVAPKRVSMNGLVCDMQRMLERIIGEDVHLATDLTPGLSSVLADPSQLQQVILNLAVNAREAMPNGGALVLRTRSFQLATRRTGGPELEPGRYIVFEAKDTGVGMDEQVRARLFEPFFTTKGRRGGTGLGLAMVYGIVRQAGGDVTVSSEPDRGSTFCIYLPEAPPSAPMAASGERPPQELPRGNETIVVAEDEPQLLALACRLLRDQGYDVLGAADPHRAFQICAKHKGPVHLLVTDVVMPRMNGRELAQAARPLQPGMKVLFMSGYIDDTSVHDISGERMPFLRKPFTPDELILKVREALGTPSEQRQSSEPPQPSEQIG